MHPLFFTATWITCLIIFATSFVTPNVYFLPVNIPFHSLTPSIKKQIQCLAENIYFEAAHEPKDGKIAVALVTLNRLASGNYASNVCDVVYQRTTFQEKIVCQFSWTCQAKEMANRLTIRSNPLYNDILDLSVRVYMNYDKIEDMTKGATYYHADYVNPGWKLSKTTKIGRHIFYKKENDLNNLNKEI